MLPLPRTNHDENRAAARSRRWIPSLPPSSVASSFDGASILDEVGGSLGVALFQRVRDVHLWKLAPKTRRRGLFAARLRHKPPPFLIDSCGEDEISGALAVLSDLTCRPESFADETVATACATVAAWATKRAFLNTALMFYEAAAVVERKSAARAAAAGRSARKQAAYDRAAEWFRRAVGLARRTGDWYTYTSAYIGWGAVEELRGNRAASLALYQRAYRAGKRRRLYDLAGAAQQEMLALAVYTAPFAQAQDHAAQALELYGAEHPMLFRLAHDTAFLWMWHGYFSLALPILEAALPFFTDYGERMLVVANIGRAAAAAGRADLFFEAWARITEHGSGVRPFPAAFLNLAHGARSLGLLRKAYTLANQALQLARQRGEKELEARALEVLAMIRTGSPADIDRQAPDALATFAATLVQYLSAQRSAPA